MPRLARKDYDTCYFHIIVQGINKEYIFNKDEYIKYYLKLLYKHKEEYNIRIIAYCIMNNHAHMLVKVNTIPEMSQYMKKVNNKYAQYYNYKEQRVGFVFRNRFKSQPIYKEEYLIRCIDYIHKNPVKANMVQKEEQYIYSSYRAYKERIISLKNKLSSYVVEPDENAFIDVIDEIVKVEDVIKAFEEKTTKTLEKIKNDKQLFNMLVLEIKCKTKLSNREISRILGKDKNTINSIVQHNSKNSVMGTYRLTEF